MNEAWLLVPILACAAGAVCAALHAVPAVHARVPAPAWGWVIALWSALAAGVLVWLGWGLGAPNGVLPPEAGGVLAGEVVRWEWGWAPAWGLSLSLRLDGLSLLMGLLVTGVGALVMGYAGHYMGHKPGAWRFFLYMALFEVSMLGVVLAGDLISLFVFWELTSITSFLLIAYDWKDEKARRGAFKALLVTGGGGVALLVGVLLIAGIVGGTGFDRVLASGDILRGHALYPLVLGLIALGACTKSAQVPFQSWLPDGMTAPTPASAYLHSATMVKAGVFLLARLHPALGGTDAWFWTFTSVGLATMVYGAVTGMRAHDLKALLAASTISQLGALTMLAGQGTPTAFKALAVGLLAHGLYKSALFMVVGIVDHETGTRDLRRLGGLAKAMPLTLGVAVLAGLSMAGLPPLMGYLAKDALVVSAAHNGEVPWATAWTTWIVIGGTMLAGALIAAQAGIVVWDTFLARRKDADLHGHDPHWGMLLGPGIPAVLGVVGALVALPTASALASAAGSAGFGQHVDVSLKFWKGFDTTKALGLIVMALSLVAFLARGPLGKLVPRMREMLLPGALAVTDAGAWAVTRIQNGQLSRYLLVMFTAAGGLVAWFGLPAWPGFEGLRWDEAWPGLRVGGCVLAGAAAVAVVFLRRDLFAILALGASGLGVSLLFLVQPAPDVALVMIVADVLTMVILVLALLRMPRECRRESDDLNSREPLWARWRDGVVAIAGGVGFALVTLAVTLDRPRESIVTPWYFEHSKVLVGASDVVGGILIDFRALDTLIEIAVFALAGVGVYALLRHASVKAKDVEPQKPVLAGGDVLDTPMVRLLAHGLLPLAIALAATHVLYGHAQPGDGFTAGVMLSLAVAFRHVVLGYERSVRSKPWLKPLALVGAGLTLALGTATTAFVMTGSFFTHINFGERWGVPLPYDFSLSTSFLFEAAIAIAVMGGGTLVIDTLSGPRASAGEGGSAWNS